MNLDQWQSDLAATTTIALAEFRRGADDKMKTFAVDCHPWNGVIALAFLTEQELQDAPFLSEAAEMAAWKYYDFGRRLASWQSASGIGSQMRTMHESDGERKDRIAEQLFQRCAAAVASKPVQTALSMFHRARDFKITIPHPDTGAEYYPPQGIRHA
jgi:hypothetical protein